MRTLTHTLLALTLAACTYDPPRVPGAASTTVRLTRADNGELEQCGAAGTCQRVPNPHGCAALEVAINDAAGWVCERCTDDAGAVIYSACGDTSIACNRLTLPEPDCLICTHAGGAVLYSTCVPAAPTCTVATPQEAPSCQSCSDAGGLVYTTCGAACGPTTCLGLPPCAAGTRPLAIPGRCCPECVPEDCSTIACADVAPPACPAGWFLTRTDCCRFVCVAPTCDALACPSPPPTCKPGQKLDQSYPHCCGVCVPDSSTCIEHETPPCAGGEIVTPTEPDPLGCARKPICKCPDGAPSTTGSCPCFPACETCIAGESYVVRDDATCCGYRCEPCAQPAPPTFTDCVGGTVETPVDGNHCPLRSECRCDNYSLSESGYCGQTCEACLDCASVSAYQVLDSTSCCGYRCEPCSEPAVAPFESCAGQLLAITDVNGCATSYECRCADYSLSADGTCLATDLICPDVICTPCVDYGMEVQADGTCCGTCVGGGQLCSYNCPKNQACVLLYCDVVVAP